MFKVHPEVACANLSVPQCHKSLCPNELAIHPTNSYLVSWIARIRSLKNSRSRKPYACRFIVLILLLVPSIGPLLIITS
jgi:hypothetical protein